CGQSELSVRVVAPGVQLSRGDGQNVSSAGRLLYEPELIQAAEIVHLAGNRNLVARPGAKPEAVIAPDPYATFGIECLRMPDAGEDGLNDDPSGELDDR